MVLWVVEFSSGGIKLEKVLLKNENIQRKIFNFDNWCNGKMSKSSKTGVSKSVFYIKNYQNHSQFFLLKNTNLGAHFLLLTFFDNSIFKSLYY